MKRKNLKKDSLLMIFYRNPELGKVKTRLAATLGDEKALAIYFVMAAHTRSVAAEVPCDKVLWYSDFVDREDNWVNTLVDKRLQRGNDLGERMSNAFADCFHNGYRSICIIGTDCLDLSARIIAEAFEKLETNDAVIGPAHDGGYYLLGMNLLLPGIFDNKKWSSPTVLAETISDFKRLGVNYYQLETLTDVDEEKDLPSTIRAL